MRNTSQQLIEDRIRDLRENTDFVLTVFESLIGYAIIAADFDGNIIAFNEGACQIYGYKPEEIVGKQSIEVFFPKDFVESGKLQQIIDGLVGKEAFSYEGEKVRKNGERFPAQVLFTLTKDKKDKVVGFVEIVLDLTERKQAEEVSVRQERLAAMGTLASMVGHEVRGPLSTIRNSAEFLKMRLAGTEDEKVKQHLDILQEEAHAADKIISDTLDFARLKELSLTATDVNSIVDEAIRRSIVPANVEIVRELRTDLPQVAVDALQMQRVFLNIVSNAIEAMSEGGTLTIAAREQCSEETGERFMELSFRDTGIGISRENLYKVFEPLFTTKPKGTGLGLATCQNIIRAHKGVMEVDSEAGKGTTVTVKLQIEPQPIKEV